MIQFYAPDLLTTGCLPPDESAHCIRVLRKHTGDVIAVTDGAGHRYRCSITEADPRATRVEIVECEEPLPRDAHELVLAFAPVKNNERTEWMLEKVVEMGVDRIIPLVCTRSERRQLKKERMERIITSAANQSLKTRFPKLEGMTPIPEFIAGALPCQKIVGYCADDVDKNLLTEVMKPAASTVICIGPEGDFTPDEVGLLLGKGFIPTTFGNARLRTETAALFGVAAYHFINI